MSMSWSLKWMQRKESETSPQGARGRRLSPLSKHASVRSSTQWQ